MIYMKWILGGGRKEARREGGKHGKVFEARLYFPFGSSRKKRHASHNVSPGKLLLHSSFRDNIVQPVDQSKTRQQGGSQLLEYCCLSFTTEISLQQIIRL